MITVSNIVPNDDARNYSVDIPIADSSITESFFDNLSHDQQSNFNLQEREVLGAMMVHSKHRSRKSDSNKQHRSGAASHKKNSDSTVTEATDILDDDASSPSARSGSSSVASFTGSVEPVKKRLTRHEENAFFVGQASGEFHPNDSFGSLDDGAFNFSANHKLPSRASPSTKSKRQHLTRRHSSSSAGSRQSLHSVEEQGQMPDEAVSRNRKCLASDLTAPTVSTDFTDDGSIDVTTIFDKTKVKKLSPVLEIETKLKKKKSSRSLRSSDSSRNSSKSKSQKSDHSVGSADDILAMLNAKIEQMEREAEVLDLELQRDEAPAPSSGYMKDPYARSASSPTRMLHKQFSVSNISSATSAMSSLSCDHHDHYAMSEKSTSLKPRRPSLHSVFEWNKEPSVRNLNADPDPPAGEDSLVVNMSSILVTSRHKLLRRSHSTSDVYQYNNTPHWPPNPRQKMTGKLHAQFYRRETKLETSNCANRMVESSPVETPQQLLKVIEPVSMREFLAFNGRSRDESVASRTNLNYGAILDNESLTSGQESSFTNRS
ncbi:hypothetical protein MHU86_112 [Fragilaria crotonensis]|nr:hypothetical protein MHU86_112 [Fragilaria crotonensis]